MGAVVEKAINIIYLMNRLEVASYESLLEWESGTLYPVCCGLLLATSLNKKPDAATKSQLMSALASIGSR